MTRKSRLRGIVSVAVAGGVLAVSAQFLAAERAVFSHEFHLEQGAGCTDCHDTAAARPTVNAAFCKDCHDEVVPAYIPPAPRRQMLAGFSHPRHVAALDCKDCHADVAADTRVGATPLVAPPRCFACHEENDIATPEVRCTACHGQDQRRVAPAGHQTNWTVRHGLEADRADLADHGRDCALCHAQNTCIACHRTSRPRSHTGLWRVRTHGPAAGWNRDACQTCHQTASCVGCHKNNAPMNHKGAWRSTHGLAAQSRGDEGCTTCHQPGWCAACHAGGAR